MNSLILPEAELDATEAAVWYELRRPGLGVEFTEELRATLRRICDWPNLWPRMDFYEGPHEVRRCHVNRRFPYRLVYWRRPDDIVVVAVAHMRRPPVYWSDRLS